MSVPKPTLQKLLVENDIEDFHSTYKIVVAIKKDQGCGKYSWLAPVRGGCDSLHQCTEVRIIL